MGVAMEQVRRKTCVAFERRLDWAGVPAPQRPDYRKGVRFYLDFCHNTPKNPRGPRKLGSPIPTAVARAKAKRG